MAFEWLTRILGMGGSEERQVTGAPATKQHLDSITAVLGDPFSQASIYRTAAAVIGLDMIGRSFMLAEPSPAREWLTPQLLYMLAVQTVGRGNAVFTVEVPNLRPMRLSPVAWYEVGGEEEPEDWVYFYRRSRPNRDNPLDVESLPVRSKRSADVVHVRKNPPAGMPWQGRSPLADAGLTSEQLARIEQSLLWDAGVPAGMTLPVAEGIAEGQKGQIAGALGQGKGKTTIVETMKGGGGQGPLAAPSGDWTQSRFGPEIQAANVALRDSTFDHVLGVLGIPPPLLRSAGGALREAHRHFQTDTVKSLGTLIAAELSDKVQPVEFVYPDIFRTDISARSRAFSSMRKSGILAMEAARLVGMPLDESGLEPPAVDLPPE